MSPVALLALFIVSIVVIISTIVRRRLATRRMLAECRFPVVPIQNLFTMNLEVTKSEMTPWMLKDLRRKYGRTYAIMQGAYPTVVTSDPDVIQEICLKQFRSFHARMNDPTNEDPDGSRNVHVFTARGERWKRIRSLISPGLTNQNLKKLFPTILDSVLLFITRLKEDASSSPSIELHRLFQSLTFDVISRCCFGRTYSDQHSDPNLELILQNFSARQKCYTFSLISFLWCLPEATTLLKAYSSVRSRIRKALRKAPEPMAVFTQNLRNIIQQKRKSDSKFDFLQFMKDVEDDEWDEWRTANDVRTEMAFVKIPRKLLSGEIVATVRFMGTAGFDTTANTLTYLTYMLACHPDVQERLRNDVESVGELTFDAVQSLEYLHWAIAETLRLFPHASLLQSRQCVEDCTVGEFEFRRGLGVVFDTWGLHHDTDIWGPDAEQFRPDRFGGERTARQMQSWTPFGVGPRMCVGMRFALIEAKLAMCYLLKTFNIHKAADHQNGMNLRLREMGTVWPDSSTVLLQIR